MSVNKQQNHQRQHKLEKVVCDCCEHTDLTAWEYLNCKHMNTGCDSKLPFIAYQQNLFLIHYRTIYPVHYKITQFKSDTSTLWKL